MILTQSGPVLGNKEDVVPEQGYQADSKHDGYKKDKQNVELSRHFPQLILLEKKRKKLVWIS